MITPCQQKMQTGQQKKERYKKLKTAGSKDIHTSSRTRRKDRHAQQKSGKNHHNCREKSYLSLTVGRKDSTTLHNREKHRSTQLQGGLKDKQR